jgi:hypothetical protein
MEMDDESFFVFNADHSDRALGLRFGERCVV